MSAAIQIRMPAEGAAKLEWALAVAELGLRVHPLHHIRENGACSCGKRCGRSAGKHPILVGWQAKATADPRQIRAMWRDHPQANIGIATGEGSDCTVVDADGEEGRASLTALEREHGPLPQTLTVRTGGGGEHRYFLHPESEGVQIANTVSKLGHKLDVRTERGNLVGPGSVHASGAMYRIACFAPLAPMPDWLVDRLTREDVAEESEERPVLRMVHDDSVPERIREDWARAYVRKVDPAIEGSGGDLHTFNTAQKIVRGFDLPEGVALRVLETEWNPTCEPPWHPRDLRRKVREAATKGRMPWGSLVRERVEKREQWRAGRSPRAARPSQSMERADDSEGRPVVRITTELHTVVDEALSALANDDRIYQRSGTLSHLVRDAQPIEGIRRAAGAVTIRPLAIPTLREVLTSVSGWEKYDRRTQQWVATLPPDAVVHAIAARGEWKAIRPLIGVIETPALRPDGSVIQKGGYDAATGYLYLPSAEYPSVPDRPTHGDALHARDELLEVVHDFPFASDAHRSAWLAFTLTLFARPAIDGCVPLGAIDATTRGTGKSRLVDATAILATGREATRTPMPQDDEECRKRITALTVEGELLACIDNVASTLDFPSLDAALTARVWKDRMLGKNATVTAPNLMVWAVTGNNLAFGADTARRTLHIRLESPLENPEDRSDFRHADLLAWVRAERPRLVRAALTILRAYVVAEMPDQGAKPWGSFEAWSRLVANAVRWIGMADPQATRLELEATADTTKSALVAMLEGWARLAPAEGLTAKGAISALYSSERLRGQAPPDEFDDLREAIEALCPPAPGKPPSPAKLGYQLRHFRRRIIGGRMLDSIADRTGVARWRVVTAGHAGHAGHVSNPFVGSVSDNYIYREGNIACIPGIPCSEGGVE